MNISHSFKSEKVCMKFMQLYICLYLIVPLCYEQNLCGMIINDLDKALQRFPAKTSSLCHPSNILSRSFRIFLKTCQGVVRSCQNFRRSCLFFQAEHVYTSTPSPFPTDVLAAARLNFNYILDLPGKGTSGKAKLCNYFSVY